MLLEPSLTLPVMVGRFLDGENKWIGAGLTGGRSLGTVYENIVRGGRSNFHGKLSALAHTGEESADIIRTFGDIKENFPLVSLCPPVPEPCDGEKAKIIALAMVVPLASLTTPAIVLVAAEMVKVCSALGKPASVTAQLLGQPVILS